MGEQHLIIKIEMRNNFYLRAYNVRNGYINI